MKAKLSLTNEAISTVTAVTAGWLFMSLIVSFTSRLLYPGINWKEQIFVYSFYLHVFDNRKPLVPVWYGSKLPGCSSLQPGHCVKVGTDEQQQWTDRLDISDTVESAGEFMVAAAATADVLFCSGVWIWYLKNPVRNWLQKCSTFSCYFVLTSEQKIRNVFFCTRSDSALPAVQFTVPGFIGFNFH